MFRLVFTGLASNEVFHKLEQLRLHLGLGGGTEISVLSDGGLQPP